MAPLRKSRTLAITLAFLILCYNAYNYYEGRYDNKVLSMGQKSKADLVLKPCHVYLQEFKASTTEDLISAYRIYDRCFSNNTLPQEMMLSPFNFSMSPILTDAKELVQSQGDDKKMLAKKGIVMTFKNTDVSLMVRMLAVLEAQGNDLPIQIIHNADLNRDSIIKISKAVEKTKQKVWFVDISPMIKASYTFEGYANKWLAVILNTFDEFIFVDADVVSFLEYEKYFKLGYYKDTGALFFYDRTFHDNVGPGCRSSLKSFAISREEANFFGSSSVSNKIISDFDSRVNHRYFVDGELHNMDSGLMVINKSKHLMALLIAMSVNLDPKFSKCGLGDKEFFWIGFSLAGHDYSFYPKGASSVGFHSSKDTPSHATLCSIQIGHTSIDNKLLWVNSGLHMCKFSDAASIDWESYPKKYLKSTFHDLKKVEAAYKGKMLINSAIIPDPTKIHWTGGFGSCCIGRTYCAKYDSDRGEFIKFDPDHVDHIDTLSQIWINATDDMIAFRN